MTRTAIQFGAGNIGRGFLAQLFHESGLEVIFVDVVQPAIDAINLHGAYVINIVGQGAQRVEIDSIHAIHASETVRVAHAVADAEIVCTAVGAGALRFTAPAIAAGLALRNQAGSGPLNVLLCENLHNAAEVLRDAVKALLPESIRDAALANTGFVQAVVSRMVPLQTEADRAGDPLGVRVEAYKHLPIDADAWVGKPANLVGVEPVSPFQAYVDRKLFTHNCAHAVLGYLGYAAGHEFGYQALHDAQIEARLRAVLEETGEALIRKHHLDPVQHAAHVGDLLARFDNRDLGDTCIRLARDPIRKLTPGDRILGAARCCEAQGVPTDALAFAIAAALAYEEPGDPSANELQRMLREDGLDGALQKVCGIKVDEPLAEQVRVAVAARGHQAR